MAAVRKCILDLHALGAIRFGSFTLKSGMVAPIYIDLRVIISSPLLLKEMSALLWDKVASERCDLLVGVPYTALPLASALSLEHNIPMIMKRKEAKEYGTKKMIEGLYKKGDHCIVIEDLVTSGASLLETILPLEAEGLIIQRMVAFLDREQGGRALLESKGYSISFVTTLGETLTILYEEEKISLEQKEKAVAFIRSHQIGERA